MRRKEREVTDFDEILAILDGSPVMRIAMICDGEDGEAAHPYIVPVNFGFTWAAEQKKLSLFFHSAPEGKKITAITKNPRVCFEAEADAAVIKADVPCKWTESYRSVIGFGAAHILTDPADKRAALDSIMKHAGYEEKNPHYSDGALARMVAVRIDAESITGKQSPAR